MILWFLHFLRGYLDVRFEGVYSEKILSGLANEKISVWHLKYTGGKIDARMYAKDFKRVRGIRKKAGVRIRIIRKHGLPFFLKRYKYRSGFVVGAVIFFALLKFLSTFIWVINVDGNENIGTADIIKTLNNIGISENMRISDIDAKQTAQSLIMKRDDLAWASLNIEGCVLNVEVSEIEKKPDVGSAFPSNLVAKKDGIIKKVDAVSGDVRVKVGENVHKGDVLVSGIIESMSSTVFVRSNATVIAQVEKDYTNKELFVRSVKQRTGENTLNSVLQILGARIPLFLPKKQKSADISYDFKQARLFGNKIPLALYSRKYNYYENVKVNSSEEELKNSLSKELENYLSEKDIEGYIPIATEYLTDDKGVTISHRYLCDVDIATESRILTG